MREASISGPPHNPGSGGWPTIRYFNKETGLNGRSYKQKTSKAICDELGNNDMLNEYIFEAGNTSFCKITDESFGCDDREVNFIKKMKNKSHDERKMQLERLVQMQDSPMKEDLKKWLLKRKRILQQFVTLEASSEL